MHPRAAAYIDKGFQVNTLYHFNGGTNPDSNYRFWFKIDDTSFHIGHLTIEIYDWGFLFGDRLSRTIRIPLADLSDGSDFWFKDFFYYQVISIGLWFLCPC